MSRRKSLLALIGIVVLLVSLAAPMIQCAPAAEEEVTPPSEEEEGTKYGGRLNAGFRAEEGIEDLRCDSTWKYETMGCLFWQLPYDQLWVMGPPPEYDILPRLATSWDMEENGKTWIFHLRDDVVFHDGEPFTAEDVAFTATYLPKADPSFSSSFGRDSEPEVTIIDDYTVSLTFDTPVAQAYYPAYNVPILPKHIWEPYKDDMSSFANEECIGTGAFKVKEFEPAQYLWFDANEDYWGGRPYVDEVVFKSYGTDDALYMALKNGEIDMIGYTGASGMVAKDFEQEDNIEIIVSPGVAINWLSFNLYKDGPLQDLNVRKAIMHGVDRDKIIDLVYLGYAEKIDSFIYPELDEHNPNLPQYDYDLDKANAMLDDSGYVDTDGDGVRNDPTTGKNLMFEVHCSSDMVESVKVATCIQEQMATIGIAGEVKVSDWTTYASYLYAPTEGMYDIGLTGEAPGPYADWMWEFTRSFDAGGEGWNTAYYNNSELDALYTSLSAETDMAKRKELLYEMQLIIAEDVPYGFLYRRNMIDPVRTDKFEGFVPNMGGIGDWTNAFSFFNVHLK